MSHVDFNGIIKKWQCLHVSDVYFPQCHKSNLRNDYVPCHYIFSPHVACHLTLCCMSNLRNAHVALSDSIGPVPYVSNNSYGNNLDIIAGVEG